MGIRERESNKPPASKVTNLEELFQRGTFWIVSPIEITAPNCNRNINLGPGDSDLHSGPFSRDVAHPSFLWNSAEILH